MKMTKEGIAILPNDLISGWVESEGRLDHDQNSLPQILPLINPGDVIADVGAHIGSHAIAYAEACSPYGEVFAFEPNLDAYACIVHNVKDLQNVFTLNVALGESEEEIAPLFIPKDNAGSAAIVSESHQEEPLRVDHAPMAKLDTFCFNRLHFLKLDCEGYEPMILAGGMETIKRCRPIIVCEVNASALARYGYTPSDLMQMITELGYRLENIYPEQPMDGPQFDVIARPI